MRRILVSGIGRSGTTLIYQQLAKLLLLEHLKTNFRYEPYLWDIKQPIVKNSPFGMEQLSHFGISTHLQTPLFQQTRTPDHDRFLNTIFAAPYDQNPASQPEASLAKVIRGSGRLRLYLAQFPDLKIIGCLRNPFDTINSGLGMFSLFGEEFHTSDRPRFKQERRTRHRTRQSIDDDLPDGKNSIEWLAAWWLDFTKETLAVARDYPDQVFLFCYEEFLAERDRVLNTLLDFIGLKNEGIFLGLNKLAGPSISSNSLTNHDILKLSAGFEFYKNAILMPNLGLAASDRFEENLMRRYRDQPFSLPRAGTRFGRMSSIQLRDLLQQKPPHAAEKNPKPRLQLDQLIRQYSNDTKPRSPLKADPKLESLKQGKTFGVVITNHNNGATINDAVLSCLNQTLLFDEIVVVDDKSTDDSLARITTLAEHYSSVKILPLESCLGPSAARDLGIRHLTTDFFTQLDGDDLFWPGKNEGEIRAINGDENTVAFSDILLVLPDKSRLQNTREYANNADVFDQLLIRTQYIPRDLTFLRRHYFAAGGYDLLASLYEDWEFKLRLAKLPDLHWRHAEAVAGTVYNRLQPGLSAKKPNLHVRALVLIFFTALPYSRLKTNDILDAFDKALYPFKDNGLTINVRIWLENLVHKDDFDRKKLATFASSRAVFASDQQEFEQMIAGFADGPKPLNPLAIAPFSGHQLSWHPHAGLAKWSPPAESHLFDLVAKGGNLFAKQTPTALIEIDIPKPAQGFLVTLFLTAMTHRLRFDIAGKTYDISVDSTAMDQRQTLPVPLQMPKGKSLIAFHTRASGPQSENIPPAIFLETVQPWPETGGRP